ncbi:nigrin b-like [Camellia sinensis]|uniref:nigrin b-like n=1 Tax=Camellia sinensis TaxID=4442 RepID=UPI001035CDFD|nr:nigrin b-like [Camellia sinensis]
MRVIAAILNIVLAICSLGIQGYVPSYPSISFNVTGATLIIYKDFMWQLREIVSWRTRTNNDLPVLNLESDVLVGHRFVLAGLSNDTNDTVTLAIDVVNLYVVAYCFDNESYFFDDATPLQLNNLFNSTHQNQLDFNNSYISLEKISGVNRTERPLGPGPLLDAIAVLWYSGNLPPSVIAESLITFFEMVSNATRFKYIEEQVRESITRANTFTPKGLIVSMEDEWRSMSKQVLLSPDGENFINFVQLQNDNN